MVNTDKELLFCSVCSKVTISANLRGTVQRETIWRIFFKYGNVPVPFYQQHVGHIITKFRNFILKFCLLTYCIHGAL
jgi:hypothetical protein